ncbi:MAG: hypothetical protein EZS28_000125 [Streblomastix strix]|uniref:Uncharacterized protein n=1 Tax=Streblomastix strix TaxID=222440 RepID=A0A5J4XBQ7_9EUKA|nr:MAG: hypothetical protein EZS28_000125 [Streblomastix strix]
MAAQTEQETSLASQSSLIQGPNKESEAPRTLGKRPDTKVDFLNVWAEYQTITEHQSMKSSAKKITS